MEKSSDIFLEIEGESVSERRLRYWQWQRRRGSRPYDTAIKSERSNLSARQMSVHIRQLISQVECLSKRLAQLEGR